MYIQRFSFPYKGKTCYFYLQKSALFDEGQYNIYCRNQNLYLSYLGIGYAFGGHLKLFLAPSQYLVITLLENVLTEDKSIELTMYKDEEIEVSDTSKVRFLYNLSKLQLCQFLEDDWFGEGSLHVDKAIIDFTRLVLPSFMNQPEIFPTSNGTIQLEWEKNVIGNKEKSYYFEIEIMPNNLLHIYQEYHNHQEEKDEKWDRILEVYREIENHL